MRVLTLGGLGVRGKGVWMSSDEGAHSGRPWGEGEGGVDEFR